MLIDFIVSNYRSIKEPVTLSAVAHVRSQKRVSSTSASNGDNALAAPFPIEGRQIDLLPVIGIFGPNASGKSNVIRALDDLFQLIVFGSREGVQVNTFLKEIVPFKLDQNTTSLPTRFELRVSLTSGIYVYTLIADQERIVKEVLEQIPPPPRRMQSRLLYSREWDGNHKTSFWKNGKAFTNKYIEIQKATKQDEPFLSLLTTRLKIPVVEDFTDWLWRRLPGVAYGRGHEYKDHVAAIEFLRRTPDLFKAVTNVMQKFDTGIADLEIRGESSQESQDDSDYEVWSLHRTEDREVWWPLEEESLGTQRLFGFVTKLLMVVNWGGMILADEFGSSIHPTVIRTIIHLFQNPKTNPKRGQLIFTSHDYTLLRMDVLRRDQIWFTQKRADGSTDLFPLTDFSPRNDLAIDKAYIDGRFGAVPILPEPEDLILKTGGG